MTYRELIEHCSNMDEGSCADCKIEMLCDKFFEIDIDKEIVNDEIIRCKDCRHREEEHHCWFLGLLTRDDDFCSFAERKEDKK